MKKAFAIALVLTVLLGGMLYSAAEKKEIKVFADMTDIPYGDKNKNVILKGNVRILHNDITLKSEYVEYNKDKNTAFSPGKLFATAPEADITADKGTGDFKNKIVKAEGNVSAVIRKSFTENIRDPEKRADVEKEITRDITVTAGHGEYDYKARIITARDAVTIKEKDRVILADSVTYDIKTEIFTLNGQVRGTDSAGQTFSSPGPVTVSVKEGNEYIKAPNAGISFFVEEDEE
ncbi:MAG: LPS export ABC transporter periplasmic protein LptC [Abditibacteriota bacterium]|nr:LPS export ABC transporter periplasmic protein LptC [Abditibacteriota bacterium]